MNCDILKSKLIFCEWNAFYFIEIAFIGFTLDDIKQCIVFFGTPGSWHRRMVLVLSEGRTQCAQLCGIGIKVLQCQMFLNFKNAVFLKKTFWYYRIFLFFA